MSKVLVDPAALEEAAKWLEVHSSSSGSAEAFAAEALREAIAQPAEAEGVSSARLMNTLAELARRAPLRTLHTICETQRQVSTVKLERYLEPVGDTLADYAFTLRIYFDKLSATLSAVTAERDSLLQFKAAHLEWHEKTEWVQETAQVHELGKHRADVLKDRIDQLRAEVDRLRNELAGKPLVCSPPNPTQTHSLPARVGGEEKCAMAMADYYLCDKCGGKCFYDANLNYEYPDKDGNDSWGNVIKDELVKGAGYKLDYLGDMAALCRECAETHEVIVRPRQPAA